MLIYQTPSYKNENRVTVPNFDRTVLKWELWGPDEFYCFPFTEHPPVHSLSLTQLGLRRAKLTPQVSEKPTLLVLNTSL
jgi:hypothetical protein